LASDHFSHCRKHSSISPIGTKRNNHFERLLYGAGLFVSANPDF